jgi:hypothetical protein
MKPKGDSSATRKTSGMSELSRHARRTPGLTFFSVANSMESERLPFEADRRDYRKLRPIWAYVLRTDLGWWQNAVQDLPVLAWAGDRRSATVRFPDLICVQVALLVLPPATTPTRCVATRPVLRHGEFRLQCSAWHSDGSGTKTGSPDTWMITPLDNRLSFR